RGGLAGDHMKSAGDLHLPVTGIGLMWDEGYTRQVIGVGGVIEDQYPKTVRDVVRRLDVRIEVAVRGKKVPLRAWKVDRYLSSNLYLLEPEREEDRGPPAGADRQRRRRAARRDRARDVEARRRRRADHQRHQRRAPADLAGRADPRRAGPRQAARAPGRRAVGGAPADEERAARRDRPQDRRALRARQAADRLRAARGGLQAR